MSENDQSRPSPSEGRPVGLTPKDERLSRLAHELGGYVLTLRLLLKSLSASASAGQQEPLRLLGELAEAQAVLASELSALSRSPREGAGPGGSSDG